MIKGIGMDILEMKRMEMLIKRQPRFADKILTNQERERYSELSEGRKIEFLAGRFAAKEAFSKAYGTGIGSEVSFLDIEICTDGKGKPYVSKPFSKGVHLTITHSREYAAAQVVIEEIE
ncbi:holo-ACP synthase [Peribacillus saganii]|uniref:Holo-[acyl-carrier-protein] synthase n=1 Tax=Peribacillus saganii TaxID=2303992 RepID=A0A372LKU6_9BACI|nr:holo-ACP synthase [Peribacillus saganii]RFU67387.1 holo-ACP synthase [Peribacillus saganii]